MSSLSKWLDYILVLGAGTSLDDAKITIESFKKQLLPGAGLRIGISAGVAEDVQQFVVSVDESCRNIWIYPFQVSMRAKILNALVSASDARYVAVVDAGEALAAGASMHIYDELEKCNFSADVLYSDEDKRGVGDLNSHVYLKPEWSPELLQSFNYFGRLTVLNTRLVKEVGLFDDRLGDATEWDLNLRISEISQSIHRVCRVLCHRAPRSFQERPTPGGRSAKFRETAIEKFWANRGESAKSLTQQDGTVHTVLDLVQEPKVSIIIPTKDKFNLITTCIRGLLAETAYQNIEIIIVDTGSKDVEVLAFYDNLRGNPKIKFASFLSTFNYSAACNLGASLASADLFLFLNNDIEVRHASWLTEMVQSAIQPGVGVVGPKILYPSGTLQAAGVFIGPFLAALAYREADPAQWGALGSPQHYRNTLSTMGCCQMISREAFLRVHGFDEKYQIAHSDTAICLNVWLAGYQIVYNPYASITHLEGSSRGSSNPDADNRRLANEVFSLGILYDPFFHPELNAQTAIPQVRRAHELKDSDSLAFYTGYLGGVKATDVIPVDIFNIGSILKVTNKSREQVLWPPQAALGICDIWSAARFCIDFIRSRVDVRQRYPLALSSQATGEFCQYLLSAEAHALGLTDAAQTHIRDLFAVDASMAVQKAYLLDSSLRQQFPLGCIPAQANELFTWLLVHGATQYQLRNEEIWWFALKWHETPDTALMLTYQTTPDWQRECPSGLTVFGAEDFSKWLTGKYGSDPCWANPQQWVNKLGVVDQIRQAYGWNTLWQAKFPLALHSYEDARALMHWFKSDAYQGSRLVKNWFEQVNLEQVARELPQLGVNVFGQFCYPSGLRTSVESLCDGLTLNDLRISKCDLPTDMTDEPGHTDMLGPEVFDISILHVQPEPFFQCAYERADIAERAKKTYRIAYWYWELDEIPDAWIQSAELADELWAPTEFIANAMRRRINKPIKTMFPGVRIKAFKPRLLEEFGLKQTNKFSFLFVFSMMSVMGRKNPIGLINAFQAAFAQHENVQLIIKTSYGYRNPIMLTRLRDAAYSANIVIIDDVYSDDMTLSLINACDAYISLHRSEGLGLTMAEAMLLGKPVIATKYSGNLDFMDDRNSLLVSYTDTKVGEECLPYMADAVWANPNEAHAGQLMRQVFENQVWARQLGKKAQQDILKRFSSRAAGQAMKTRLKTIAAQYGVYTISA
jgi:GT2 family glycosyltransferase/glycosyltransferase involved in cell wall biosynthesis